MKRDKEFIFRMDRFVLFISSRLFTMVELLVVISVIAMLMAMMMPALRRAKESAKNSQCINNRHQYELAERMYEDAYDEQPSESLDLLISGNFLKTDKLMECPSGGVYLWIGERGRDIAPEMGCSIHYYPAEAAEESGNSDGDSDNGDSVDSGDDGDSSGDTGDSGGSTGDESTDGGDEDTGGGNSGAVDPLTALLFAAFAFLIFFNIPLKDERTHE